MSRLTLGLAALAAATAMTAPASAQTTAIIGGTLVTGDGAAPQIGTLLLKDGKVAAMGSAVAVPAGATIVDATGKWVTPGLFAGFSRLGLADVDLSADGADDSGNNGPFSAALDVAPGINPAHQPVAVNRRSGFTRALVAPNATKSIFGGQGAIIDLGADAQPITRSRAFQFVELGQGGAQIAGGSRPAAYALLRNALRESGDLVAGRSGAAPKSQGDDIGGPVPDPAALKASRADDVLLTRYDAAALAPVVRGDQLLLAHVERASDILNVLKLRSEFPRLRLVLVGVSEGWMVADALAKSGVWVIASALNDLPASFEMLAATQSNIGRMRAAGVKVAIGTVNDDETRYARNARQYAGNLVALAKVPGASGLSWSDAFAMISATPAEAVGLGGRYGVFKPGAAGDAVIWSGDPLELSSNADAVFIDGVRQPLTDHQTKLRDRYSTLERQGLPEAYRR